MPSAEGISVNITLIFSLNQQLRRLGGAGTSVDDAVFAITTDDVRDDCEVFEPVYNDEYQTRTLGSDQ
ncbi:hypothetical protein [Streptomyces goshikiensis]|uniref:hypothetical protein n=1 Tax=Streptomyces goshikiensis TaxID=1942 RepID=UPI00366883DD